MKKLSTLMVLMLVIAMLPTFAMAQKGPAVEVVGDDNTAAAVPSGYPAAKIPEALLYDNGPLVTHPGQGYMGADASVLQTNLGLSTYGFGNQYSYGYRMADDFTITDPGGWQVDGVVFFAYQTGTYAYPPVSTINGLYFQIWDGSPDDPGSSIVFGDLVTNRLAGTSWATMYRVTDYDLQGATRPPMANVGTAGVVLPPGTYWLDWLTNGSGASGPWAPPISIVGETTTGNALQYTGAWAAAVDTGLGTPQGMPFLVYGEVLGGGQDPDIEVTPASLYAEQCPDTITTQTLQICNVGTADLTWTLSEATAPKAPEGQHANGVGGQKVLLQLDAVGGGSIATNPPAVNAPVSLVLDDGSRENDIGIGGTLEMIWVNRFTPDPGLFPFDLTEVQVYFSAVGLVNVGDDMRLVMYENTTGNNDPAVGSNFLTSFDVTVQALDTWNVYTLPTPVTFAGPGDAVIGLIGLEVPGTSYWPASIDQTATQARSWAGWWNSSPPPEPPLLPPPNWTLIDAYFPGNWMVRGYGETGAAPGVPWLAEDPVEGTVAPGTCQDVTVTFDSTGLAVGDYFADLVIDSNDPDEPTVTVPVQLAVVECGNTVTCGTINYNLAMDPYGRLLIRWNVLAFDQNGTPVPLVAVTADLTSPWGSGTRSRLTHYNGFAKFPWGSQVSGDWTIDVTNMVIAGYTFADGPQCSATTYE
ncbi:MAG TPA: hypothetical protein PKO09_16770 [Anaerolineae bacterium]|nr:hypothetical protein [Anaerolineae bacterium]